MTMPAAQRTPAVRFNQSFSGTTNVGSGLRPVYLLGEILATGTMSEGDIVGPITNQAEASTAAGAQSILAYMAAKALVEEHGGDTVPLYLVGVAEPGAGVTASQTFTYTGTADSDNTHSVNIGGETISWLVEDGDNATTAGDSAEAAINLAASNGDHPWSAANVTGTVTVTCKNKGTIGNSITTSVITIGTEGTQTLVAGAATMASGSSDPTLTTPLGNIATTETDFIAYSGIDGTNLEVIRAHVVTKGNVPEQIACRAVWGDRVALATFNSTLDTLDAAGPAQRLTGMLCEATDTFPPVIAAQGAVALASEPDVARPLNGLALTSVKAPTVANRFTVSECETLLANGATPLRTESSAATKVKIVRAVCVRTDLLDPLDITKIATMDEARDRMRANIIANLDRAKLKKDGEPVYTSGTVTADSVLSLCKDIYRAMEMEDKVQGYETGLLDQRFVGEYGGVGRIELTIPEDVVDGAHDIAGDQILQLS